MIDSLLSRTSRFATRMLMFWQYAQSSDRLHWLRTVLTTFFNVTLLQITLFLYYVVSQYHWLVALKGLRYYYL